MDFIKSYNGFELNVRGVPDRYLISPPIACPICKKGYLIIYEALAPKKDPPPAEAAA